MFSIINCTFEILKNIGYPQQGNYSLNKQCSLELIIQIRVMVSSIIFELTMT